MDGAASLRSGASSRRPNTIAAGRLFDKMGMKILALPFVLSVFPVLFVSFGNLTGVIAACVMFGFVLGMQESIYHAAVSEFVPLSKRGTAYGVFNALLGFGTLASGVIFGFLIDSGCLTMTWVGFTLTLQTIAVITLLKANMDFKQNGIT